MKFNFINFLGLSIVLIIMVPNILYAIRFPNAENKCTNQAMNIIEQIGRYASFTLMFIPLGIWEFGFPTANAMFVYVAANAALLIAYLLIWIFYFNIQSTKKALALAILPTCIFLVSGLTLLHWLLILSALIFGIGHLFVTWQNNLGSRKLSS